ncbi:MAG: 1-acyl-sn-glycerol-3-phosphate acyltransferase [Clostridiales bacterium]|nr:1-acyl-sn-glycerol-3-phosphate acyltransferase [Clostridiales bacterium]
MDTEKNVMPEKRERTPVYTIARGLAWVLFHTVFPVRYHHTEKMDLRAPYIMIANHKSGLDPIVLAVPCKDYEIRFVGKKELTKNKLLAWLVGQLHMITVDRHNSDLAAMRLCIKALREKQVLGIFPEGTRHLPDLMSEVETGTAVLALRAKVPLLPVYISSKLRPFHITHVYVGETMDISDLCAQGCDTQTAEQVSQRIRETFYAMRENCK